jgi:hypothetical protein
MAATSASEHLEPLVPHPCRISIVALARKLLIAVWRYVTQGEVPEGAVLKA